MKILVIDNYSIFRKGIITILKDNFANLDIHEASDIDEALLSVKKYPPQTIFIDININGGDKYKFIEMVKQEYKDVKIVAIGNCIKKDDFTKATILGINGFILRNALVEDFIYAINVINRGKTYVDPELLTTMNFINNNNIENLTRREQDVLFEISKGRTNNEIAQILFISEHTVKKHIGSILSKLNLSNRTEAALYAGETLHHPQYFCTSGD